MPGESWEMGLVPGGTQMHVTFLVQGMRDREAVIGWPGRSGSGEVLGEWSLCPFSSYSLSVTKAQTYPNPHGPGPEDSGDPSAGHPKPSVCRALQSGGWQAPHHLHRWIQDQLRLWPTPANTSSCPLPGLLLHLAAP